VAEYPKCVKGVWSYDAHSELELSVTNPDGSSCLIKQEEVSTSKKTLGIYDAPAGGNQGHLEYIFGKLTKWIARMKNGHLPSHMALVAYKQQLWPGIRYGLGTMTNDLESTETIFDKADYETLPILGVARTIKRELRKLEQLICRINTLLQHYHTSTSTSKKLDASLRYLQLQLGTPNNPLTLPFDKWGYVAPLSWVKMLWQSMDAFSIQLYMKYPGLSTPRERDRAVMEIILDGDLSMEDIKSLNRCRRTLQCIFLSDLVTADGRYLESFVFDPGPYKRCSTDHFPPERPTRGDWNKWCSFWHNYTATGGKLRVPLGRWIHPSHRKWLWFVNTRDELH
jgi:hypothetical protein